MSLWKPEPKLKKKIAIVAFSILLATSCEAAPAAQAVSFVTFGDWGTGSDGQKTTAKAIGKFCKQDPCQFVLALGDNFYNTGVASTQDPKWQSFYKNIYHDLQLPFYAVIGNHDEKGSVAAQIDYSQDDSSWRLPGRFYSIVLPQNATQPLVEIFVINNGDYSLEPAEKTWLEQALQNSHATWKILALHIPIISNGLHGDNDSKINNALVPLICGKIDVVLAGHEHHFSHLKGVWEKCPIDQLIVGTGGAELRPANPQDPRTLSTGSFFGFGWLNATASTLEFKMIKDDGTAYYQTTWKK